MKVAPTIILSTLLTCFVFGLVSQELLFSKDIGFNLAVLSLLFFGALVLLKRNDVIDKETPIKYLAVPFAVAIYGFAVPDSRGLDALNLSMLMLCIGYCCLRTAVSRPLTLIESLGKIPALLMVVPFAGMTMPWLADWGLLRRGKRMNVGRGVLVGGVAAIPFLVVFGNILAQADPMFGRLFSINMDADFESVTIRICTFCAMSAILAGSIVYMSKAMFKRVNIVMAFEHDPSRPYSYPIGPTMTPVSRPDIAGSRENEYVATFVAFFGLIAAMFLIFVLVQLRYLFGGDSVVLQTEHLTYAEYARRGFLEIVSVAAICLPMVIFSQYSLRKIDEKVRRAVNVVVVVIVALLMLLLASAAFRLKLYVGAYGLTPLRVYVAAGMLWLLVLFAAYLRYGTQWKLDKIGKIVYARMVAITLGLNFARPDYWVARVNLTRKEAKNLDPNMILGAGADALSAIEQYGKATTVDSGGPKDFLAAFRERQASRSHLWKDMTLTQLMMPQK